MTDQLSHYIAIGNAFSWGRAETEKAAIANMRKNQSGKTTEYVVWHCPANAHVVDHLGGAAIAWDRSIGVEPVRVKHIKDGKPKAKKEKADMSAEA